MWPQGALMVGGPVAYPNTGSRTQPEALEDPQVAAEAYCVKCKTKRQIKDAVQITMKNGRPGKCPECGTKMFKIGAAS
jgi:DNA-directed RNA polymerase subunit RPC12/RpoP